MGPPVPHPTSASARRSQQRPPWHPGQYSAVTHAALVVITLCAVAGVAAMFYNFDLGLFDEYAPDDEGDRWAGVAMLITSVPAIAGIWLLVACLPVSDDLRVRRHRVPGAPTSPRRAWIAVASLTAVTSVVWLVWIGWDSRKDVDAFGNESGPWEVWQILGLVGCLAVVAVVATRWLPFGAIVSTMSVTVTVEFSLLFVFGLNQARPSDPLNGFWIVASGLIFFAMVVGTALCAGAALAVRRPSGTR